MREYLKKTSHNYGINAFSIDVEGFVESNRQSFDIPQKYINQAKENNEIAKNVSVLLEILGEVKVKATFFFIGRMARDIPEVVKAVAQEGHEIGCHSYAHTRIYDLGQDEFKKNISAAKCRLEDVSGCNVYGFRAPEFIHLGFMMFTELKMPVLSFINSLMA